MGLDILKDPIRKIPLPLVPDAWAVLGAQIAVPAGLQRLLCDAPAVRYTLIPYTGVGPSATPVDGAGASADSLLVKFRLDSQGNTTLEQLASTVETSGDGMTEAPAGNQITEDDISPDEQFYIGLRAATAGSAGALWLFINAGADRDGA